VRQVHDSPVTVVELVAFSALEVAPMKSPGIVKRLGAPAVEQGGFQGDAVLRLRQGRGARQGREAGDHRHKGIPTVDAVVFTDGWNSILCGWHIFSPLTSATIGGPRRRLAGGLAEGG
jgi:hypothetical protein